MLVDVSRTLEAELEMLSPKRRRGAPERQAQVAVVSFLRSALPPGSMVAAVKNEHQARAKTAGAKMRFQQKRKQEGVKAGFPDLVILVPGGRAILLEMKAPKNGRLSPAQVECHAQLRSLGFIVGTARSIDEAQLIMQQAGVPLRGRA